MYVATDERFAKSPIALPVLGNLTPSPNHFQQKIVIRPSSPRRLGRWTVFPEDLGAMLFLRAVPQATKGSHDGRNDDGLQHCRRECVPFSSGLVAVRSSDVFVRDGEGDRSILLIAR